MNLTSRFDYVHKKKSTAQRSQWPFEKTNSANAAPKK